MSGDDGGGFFGGRQVSQHVTISEKSEQAQIVKGTLLFWLFLWIASWMIYFLVNISVGVVGVRIISVASIVVMSTVSAFFLNKLAVKFWPRILYQLRRDSRPVITFKTKYLFVTLGILMSASMSLIATPYMEMLMVFPQDSDLRTKAIRIVLYGSVMLGISGIVALVIGSWRFFLEVTDRHHAALEIERDRMRIEWEERQLRLRGIHPEWFPTSKSSRSVINQNSLPDHSNDTPFILVNTSARKLTRVPSQRDEPKEFWRIMIEEFVKGIDSGRWTTAETSWPGKTMPGTKFRVSSIAPSVRNGLISAGLAAWRHPSDQRQGWDLLETPQEIINRHLSVEELIYQETNGDDSDD